MSSLCHRPPPLRTIASPRHNRLHISGVAESQRRTEEFNIMTLMSEKLQQPSQCRLLLLHDGRIKWWDEGLFYFFYICWW